MVIIAKAKSAVRWRLPFPRYATCILSLPVLILLLQFALVSIYMSQVYERDEGALTTEKTRQESSLHMNLTSISIPTTGNEIINELFPYLSAKENVITRKDAEVGNSWKTYVVPLKQKFHETVFLTHIKKNFADSKDYVTNPHNSDVELGHQTVDHVGEVVILQKLLSSLKFVSDYNDADLVLVPALPVTASISNGRIRNCRIFGRCSKRWFNSLAAEVKRLSPNSTKKHLFFATQDESQNHSYIRDKSKDPNNIVVTYGPKGGPNDIVVPSLNTLIDLQPKDWTGCVPLQNRSTFLMSNFRIRDNLLDRKKIQKELDAYKGSKSILSESLNPARTIKMLSDSIFTICPPGDLPFTKRFYDALLSCSIPVVVTREVKDVGKTYWSNVKYDGNKPIKLEESYPSTDFLLSDIVIEVEGSTIDNGGVMKHLESIPQHEIEAKFEKIAGVRNSFVYDLNGSTEDAFSQMLKEISTIVLHEE